MREVEGLVFVCPAQDPPDFDAFSAALGPQLAPHRLADTRVAARTGYRVAANWKTLVENNRECYHFRGSHPEFTLSNVDLGVNGDVRSSPRYEAALAEARARWESREPPSKEVSFPGGSWYRIQRLPLREGSSPSRSTERPPVAPLLGDLTEADAGSLRVAATTR